LSFQYSAIAYIFENYITTAYYKVKAVGVYIYIYCCFQYMVDRPLIALISSSVIFICVPTIYKYMNFKYKTILFHGFLY